jgi:hypothetical protein
VQARDLPVRGWLCECLARTAPVGQRFQDITLAASQERNFVYRLRHGAAELRRAELAER